MRPRIDPLLVLAWANLCLWLVLIPVGALRAREQPAPATAGAPACLDCHEEMQTNLKNSPHGRLLEETPHPCAACHGPGSRHVEDADPASIYNPATDYEPTEPNPCLDCHTDSKFAPTFSSAHHEVANGCSDCHVIHRPAPQLLKAPEYDLCSTCHVNINSKFMLTSHHPVRERLMTCTNCHALHGGDELHVHTADKRDLCLSCHSEKEGPFVFEHEPVNEDCMICHEPHGTVAEALLKQQEPFLCMSCHYVHFHTGLTGFVGNFTAPLFPDRGGTSTREGFKPGMLSKCTRCHQEIHGSDLPSQSISSRGRALTR